MIKAFGKWLSASWDSVRTSLWLIPGLMFLLGAGLAYLMPHLDGAWSPNREARSWMKSGDGEDARNLLSTLLTSVITMASMAFSVTVIALSLAANTFGPRLIRTFRANLRTQIVLGTFMLTIVYLLLVLRLVHGAMGEAEVPHASVALGSLLAIVSVLALLAFIQGVATSIVADEVIRRVRRELDAVVKELPALDASAEAARGDLPAGFEDIAARVELPTEGYVQAVEYDEIVDWAAKHNAIVRLDFRPGDFVVEGDRKLRVYPCPGDAETVRKQLERFIVSGEERTPTQDIEFAIRHLVEVAVRALSPGINDPFTAMAVLDRLRGGLARLAGRQLPSATIEDKTGKVRVSRRVTTYAGAVDAALDQIRQAASSKPAVLIHMLETLGGIAEYVRTEEQRSALIRHASLVRAAGMRDVEEPADREDLEQAFERAMRALRKDTH